MTSRPCTNTEPTSLADALREVTSIPESYRQYGPEAAEILWKQHQLITRLEREIDALTSELRQRAEQIGVACHKHDLTHSLACGQCMNELRAENEVLKIKNSSLCSAVAEAADVMEKAGIDILAQRYKAALRGEGEK